MVTPIPVPAAGRGENMTIMQRILAVWPFTTIPLTWYMLVVLFTGGARGDLGGLRALEARAFTVEMRANGAWIMTWGEVLIAVALVVLFIETVRGVRATRLALWNHGLSMAVFILSLLLFMLFAPFSTGVFFILMLICLIDFGAGFIVTTVAATREVSFNH